MSDNFNQRDARRRFEDDIALGPRLQLMEPGVHIHASFQARYDSYFCLENTHINGNGRIREFAYAGLAFVVEDMTTRRSTKCFQCGLSVDVNVWRPDHDPAVQHTHLSPQCEFVRLQFGQRFVDAVLTVMPANTDSQQVRISISDVQEYMVTNGITLDQRNEDYLQAATIRECQQQGLSLTRCYQVIAPGQSQMSGGHQQVVRRIRPWIQTRDGVTCLRCFNVAVEVMLHPCGHKAFCVDCSFLAVRCPVCQTGIAHRSRVNF